jgi:hypothetical protein
MAAMSFNAMLEDMVPNRTLHAVVRTLYTKYTKRETPEPLWTVLCSDMDQDEENSMSTEEVIVQLQDSYSAAHIQDVLCYKWGDDRLVVPPSTCSWHEEDLEELLENLDQGERPDDEWFKSCWVVLLNGEPQEEEEVGADFGFSESTALVLPAEELVPHTVVYMYHNSPAGRFFGDGATVGEWRSYESFTAYKWVGHEGPMYNYNFGDTINLPNCWDAVFVRGLCATKGKKLMKKGNAPAQQCFLALCYNTNTLSWEYASINALGPVTGTILDHSCLHKELKLHIMELLQDCSPGVSAALGRANRAEKQMRQNSNRKGGRVPTWEGW